MSIARSLRREATVGVFPVVYAGVSLLPLRHLLENVLYGVHEKKTELSHVRPTFLMIIRRWVLALAGECDGSTPGQIYRKLRALSACCKQ